MTELELLNSTDVLVLSMMQAMFYGHIYQPTTMTTDVTY